MPAVVQAFTTVTAVPVMAARPRGILRSRRPRLAGLDPAYLTRQLANYRDGLRGTDPGDRPGRQMAMMAGTLTDKQSIADVLAYVASLAGVETVAP